MDRDLKRTWRALVEASALQWTTRARFPRFDCVPDQEKDPRGQEQHTAAAEG